MKKFISIVVILILVATVFCGCSTSKNATEPEDTSTSTTTNTTDEIDISIFPEVKASSENLETYRKEVSSRTEGVDGDESFISEKDWNIIQLCWDEKEVLTKTNVSLLSYSKLYNETYEYNYPVVFRDGEALIMWYTTDSGSILLEDLYGHWNESNYVGPAHCDDDSNVVITNQCGSQTIYCQETGEVSFWSFGEKFETVEVPKGAEYCGHSYFEGYIFRINSDVYALRTRFFEEGKEVECIAHNVKYVIDASYDFGSDPWSQPLFLMKDGTVKCYISWEGDKDAAPDDSSHLCGLQNEGGYHKGEK